MTLIYGPQGEEVIVLKNKLMIIIFAISMVFMTACSSNSVEVIEIENANAKVEKTDEDVDIGSQSKTYKEDVARQLDELELEIEPITLEDEVGKGYNNLSDKEIDKLSVIYDEIAEFEITDSNSEEYDDLWKKFNDAMRDMGLAVPYKSYADFAMAHKTLLSITDYKRLIEIEKKLNLTGDMAVSDEKFVELNKELDSIFTKYKFPAKEVKSQINMKNIQLALFEVKDGQIILSKDSIKQDISKEDILLYEKFWKHVKLIVPSDYIDILTVFEINTDGLGNVMAHVIQEKEDLSVWRLAVDLKDSANAKGEFTSEFNNTLIHEFAHVLSLNKKQMQMDEVTDESTFEVQEGLLKKDAYLNKFYQEFWKEIFDEHKKALDEDYENGMPSGGDAVLAFYEKYEDRFVTDYAATNPGEDIAESYRFFIVENKPLGNEIKDKKVLFFYDIPEFIKMRNEIRGKLGL